MDREGRIAEWTSTSGQRHTSYHDDLAPDGFLGNALVAWVDTRGGEPDIYGQRR
jgi:hypothetical protein